MLEFEERVEKRLNDHADRIRLLEITDATANERITALYQKIDELMRCIDNWMKFAQNLFWKVLGAAGGIISLLALFFVWYIQSLPR